MAPRIHFFVSAPCPDNHLFYVRMEVSWSHLKNVQDVQDVQDIHMPVWIPGSYMVREYPRHVQNLRAVGSSGIELEILQTNKSTWRLFCQDHCEDGFALHYEVFAHELAVRTNHLDATHGFYNGVALFFYHPDWLASSVDVTYEDIPKDWEVFCGLEPVGDDGLRFKASDFDVLFDTPVELGGPHHDVFVLDVRGVPHRVVVWGEGNYDQEVLKEDIAASVAANADLFDGTFPYKEYTFIIHLSERGRGGLEHLNSTVLLWSTQGFRHGSLLELKNKEDGTILDESHLSFMRLVAHEHYHTWNIKRIRPERLGPFDYQSENYTRDLWTVEGVTSYYEVMGLLRAGLIDGHKFLKIFADSIHALEQVPGRLLHSLEVSSFNAWVKLYRPDEHTINSSVSYYLKGEVVCFLLDAYVRAHSQGSASLDDVLRALWAHFLETGQGYKEGSYGDWIKQATGVDADAFIDLHVRQAVAIDCNAVLSLMGLCLHKTHDSNAPRADLGAGLVSGCTRLSKVPTGSPAHRAGVYAQDELVAWNGARLTPDNIHGFLARHKPHDVVRLHVFRRGQLLERKVTLGESLPNTYTIALAQEATLAHHDLLKDWLGVVPKRFAPEDKGTHS